MIQTSIGGGILLPSINSVLTKSVSRRGLGILGISAALSSGANTGPTVSGGALFDLYGTSMPFLTFGLIMTALLAGALRWIGHSNPRGATTRG